MTLSASVRCRAHHRAVADLRADPRRDRERNKPGRAAPHAPGGPLPEHLGDLIGRVGEQMPRLAVVTFLMVTMRRR